MSWRNGGQHIFNQKVADSWEIAGLFTIGADPSRHFASRAGSSAATCEDATRFKAECA